MPPAVEKTVAEQRKGATILGFSTETEDGNKTYEVELTVNGHSRDISMDAQGNIIEVKEEVAFSSLPPAVKDASLSGFCDRCGGRRHLASGGTTLRRSSAVFA